MRVAAWCAGSAATVNAAEKAAGKNEKIEKIEKTVQDVHRRIFCTVFCFMKFSSRGLRAAETRCPVRNPADRLSFV